MNYLIIAITLIVVLANLAIPVLLTLIYTSLRKITAALDNIQLLEQATLRTIRGDEPDKNVHLFRRALWQPVTGRIPK